MSRAKASDNGTLIAVVIVIVVGWLVLSWPYYVGGWLLEIAYLFWLTYMAAMYLWWRHGRAPAGSRGSGRRRAAVTARPLYEPQRSLRTAAQPARALSYAAPAPPHPTTAAVPRRPASGAPPPYSAADAASPQQRSYAAMRFADMPPHGIGPVLLERLAAAGFQSYADYAGHRIDRSGTRPTVYLLRSDGMAIQVPGIGPDKAMALDAWCAVARQGRFSQPRSTLQLAIDHKDHRVFWFDGSSLTWGCWDCDLHRVEGELIGHVRHERFGFSSVALTWSCGSCNRVEVPF